MKLRDYRIMHRRYDRVVANLRNRRASASADRFYDRRLMNPDDLQSVVPSIISEWANVRDETGVFRKAVLG